MTDEATLARYRESTRRWRATNPEKNREVAHAANARYYAAEQERHPRYGPPKPRQTVDERREHGRAWRATHRAELTAKSRVYREAHPRPHDPEDRRRRYEATHERDREQGRLYRETHHEEIKAAHLAWRKAHPDEHRAIKRRAKRAWQVRYPDKKREQRRRNAKRYPEKKREQRRRWRLADPARAAMYDRTKLLKNYNLTQELYEEMRVAQGGLCAICQQPETRTTTDKITGLPKVSALAIDHDHATGVVRGLLCHACNNGIGLLHDDPERLAVAMAYLTPSLLKGLAAA